MHDYEPPAQLEPQLLAIAVLTVLHKNKARLSELDGEAGSFKMEAIAHEIATKALALQQITDAALRELDAQLHPREALPEDGKR